MFNVMSSKLVGVVGDPVPGEGGQQHHRGDTCRPCAERQVPARPANILSEGRASSREQWVRYPGILSTSLGRQRSKSDEDKTWNGQVRHVILGSKTGT